MFSEVPSVFFDVRVGLATNAKKINAAQASHLGRIGRECRACPLITLGDEVCAHETAFPKECTFLAHAARL